MDIPMQPSTANTYRCGTCPEGEGRSGHRGSPRHDVGLQGSEDLPLEFLTIHLGYFGLSVGDAIIGQCAV